MSGVPAEDLLDLPPGPGHLLGLDGEIGERTLGLARRLVQQYLRVLQHGPPAGRPGARSTAAAEDACPMQMVATSGRMYCIVS